MGLDPVTMALMAVSTASTASQISATNKAAQAAGRAANASTLASYTQQQAHQEEVKAEAGAKLTEQAIKRNAERASIIAASGESGVAGLSPIRELANSYMQQSFDTGTIVSKEEAQLRTSGMQAQASYLEGVSAINKANSQIASPLSAMLQIGAAAGTGYLAGSQMSTTIAKTNPASWWVKPL